MTVVGHLLVFLVPCRRSHIVGVGWVCITFLNSCANGYCGYSDLFCEFQTDVLPHIPGVYQKNLGSPSCYHWSWHSTTLILCTLLHDFQPPKTKINGIFRGGRKWNPGAEIVPFKRSAVQLNVPSTPMMLGGPPMDISPDISPPLQSRNVLETLLTLSMKS